MSKTSATLFLGMVLGAAGFIAYRRLREVVADEDAEYLLARICDHLLELEIAKKLEASSDAS